MSESREAFEKWVTEELLDFSLDIDEEDGTYLDIDSHINWQTWQASRQAIKDDGWIKCSERLPSEADHYLVALSDPEDVGWVTDKAWTAFYNKGGEWDCCEAVEDGQPVTHWMPLPEPPEGDDT